MAGDWQSGLGDEDDDSMPQLASPLTAAGLDPDMVRLQSMAQGKGAQSAMARTPAQQEATLAGAGAAPAPTDPNNPAAPRPPTPPTAGPRGFSMVGGDALTQEMEAGRQQMQTAADVGTVDPKIAELQQKERQDQAGGPNASDYKPGFGTRLLRGLRAVALGAAAGGVEGAAVGAIDPARFNSGKGYGAPTDAYDTALEAHNKLVGTDAQDLADAEANFKARQDALKERQSGLKDATGSFNDVSQGASKLEDADTTAAQVPIDQEKADTDKLKAQNDTPGAKAQLSAMEFDQRGKQATQQGLKGENRILYILNGKIPDPRQATAEELASAEAMRVFIKEKGRAPNTLAEYQTIQQAAKGTPDKANTQEGANLRRAANNAQSRLKDLGAMKTKLNMLGQWSSEDEQRLTEAQKEYDDMQGQLQGQAPGAPAAASKPPDSLLKSTAEGGTVYGKGGEAWTRKGNEWVAPQPR